MPTKSTKVAAITQRMSKTLTGLKRDLVALGRVVEGIVESQRALSLRVRRSGGAAPGRAERKARNLTPKDRERLRVQGEYLGLVRHLSARNSAKVKDTKAKKGYGPALRLARQLGKRRS